MTSASPRSILVFSSRHHIMSNAPIVNNCIASHPNAHVVNRPLHRNRKSITKFSSGKYKKKLFKNVTLQIPNLILPNRMFKQYKKQRKENVTLHDIGNILLVGERGGSVVACRTPEQEVGGSKPTAAVLCP